MNVVTIRTKIDPASADDLHAAIGNFFSALEREQPGGIRYTSCQLEDGATYLTLLELDDGVENPLPTLAEFAEFQKNVKQWAAEPPVAERFTVVASYRS